jgi:hypothetical protein
MNWTGTAHCSFSSNYRNNVIGIRGIFVYPPSAKPESESESESESQLGPQTTQAFPARLRPVARLG